MTMAMTSRPRLDTPPPASTKIRPMRDRPVDPPPRPRGRVGCLGSLLILVAVAIGDMPRNHGADLANVP